MVTLELIERSAVHEHEILLFGSAKRTLHPFGSSGLSHRYQRKCLKK